jgi:hypothetical protein
MSRPVVLRALRLPILLIAVLVALWLAMSSLERTGPSTHALKATNVSSQNNAKGGEDKGDKGDDKNKHCDDGHGKDGDKNKHCRPISDD